MMEGQFEPLDADEVLFVNLGRVLMPNATFKVGEFLDALAQAVSEREAEWADENEGWFGDGLECEVLRFGNQGWQRGKVRLRLEFMPETPPPPKLLETRRAGDARRAERLDSRMEDLYRPSRSRPEDYEEEDLDDTYS